MSKPVVKLNVVARDIENGRQVLEAAEGNVYIGLMVKNFPSVAAAVETVHQFQSASIPVSIGLGAGDPAVWKEVAQVAVQTKPLHVNQAFPAAGYTLGALRSVGSEHTLVNAMIAPSGTVGKVYITTGPKSYKFQEPISCHAAATMLAEIGVHSVKFYPIGGTSQLDEVAAMVRAATDVGIEMFEPTGGINADSIGTIVQVCADNGAQVIVPHIYTSIIDPATGMTRIEDIHRLFKHIK
jgi:2-dehydro-3-deoxy-phosphogluconate aldolase